MFNKPPKTHLTYSQSEAPARMNAVRVERVSKFYNKQILRLQKATSENGLKKEVTIGEALLNSRTRSGISMFNKPPKTHLTQSQGEAKSL